MNVSKMRNYKSHKLTLKLVEMSSNLNNLRRDSSMVSTKNSFSQYHYKPQNNRSSMTQSKFRASQKTLNTSRLLEQELNKEEEPEGNPKEECKIKNKVVDLEPGETKVVLYQMTEVKSKAKMVNKVTFKNPRTPQKGLSKVKKIESEKKHNYYNGDEEQF